LGDKQSLRQRWTRHSLVLIGAGAIYVSIGVAFLNASSLAKRAPSLKVALHVIPIDGWGIIYILIGAAAMASSMMTFWWKVRGYMILAGLSSGWAAFYIMAIFFEDAPTVTWVNALIFLLLSYIWITVSGLISPERARELVKEAADVSSDRRS